MKKVAFAFAGVVLFSTWAHAAETLDAGTVKKLVTGNTVVGVLPDGGTIKNYFSDDGKIYRLAGGVAFEGTWQVKDDGTHCIDFGSINCAKIVKNDDGSYNRVMTNGKVAIRWTQFVNGKDF